MNKILITSMLVAFSLNLFSQEVADLKGNGPIKIQKIYQVLMAGTMENDLVKFHSVCDSEMKSAITKIVLSSVNESVAPLITKEYQGEYIGFYMKDAIEVHLYKIAKKSPSNDLLVILSVKADKCVGLLFQ